MDTFVNIVKDGEDTSLGIAVQKLIEDNLSRLNTSFLAKITAIGEDGFVDIVDIVKGNFNEKNPIIPNCVYGIPSTSNWVVSNKPAVGDYGLAIVLKKDICIYKNNKTGGVANTKRLFNINDTIFLPLTLLNQPPTDNFSISSKDNKVKINLTNDTIDLTTEKSSINIKDSINLTSDKIDLTTNNGSIELKSNKGIKLKGGGGSLSDLMEAVITYVSACQFGVYPYNSGTSKVAETMFKQTIKKFEEGASL